MLFKENKSRLNFVKGVLIMAIATFLTACAGPDLKHYNDTEPKLSMEEYFNGPIKAWGIVQDRKGNIVRRFEMDMNATWDGDTGTLEEDFQYYDGKEERRVWVIQRRGDGQYTATSEQGIIGEASGATNGYAVRWQYDMDITVGDQTYRMAFDDWMFQMKDGVMINRAYMKKFGIKFAEVTLFMQKQ